MKNKLTLTNTRCKGTLIKFIKYMNDNPDQRFFQGIRNMFRISFLMADEVDTFYNETEELLWGTADGEYLFYNELDDQHLSNIHYMYKTHNWKIPKQVLDEIEKRGLTILPYKPYYDEETENKILGIED